VRGALKVAAAALALAAAACSVPQLTRPSQVLRLRVLGIRAEPPEVALGESTTFSYVIGNPGGIEVENLWLLCTEIDTGLGYAVCGSPIFTFADPFADTFTFTPTADTVVGTETDDAGNPVEQTLGDALAEMDPVNRVEGIGFLVYLVVLPSEDMTDLIDEMAAMADPDADPDALSQALADLFGVVAERGELATKRVVVADKAAMEPEPTAGCEAVPGLENNRNPDLSGITRLDPETLLPIEQIAETGTFVLAPGESMTLEPRITDGSIETYYYITVWDELTECRTEEPLYGWYATDGSYDGDYSFEDLDGTPGDAVYTAPDADPGAPIDLWLVTWDRRGGLDWIAFHVDVTAG